MASLSLSHPHQNKQRSNVFMLLYIVQRTFGWRVFAETFLFTLIDISCMCNAVWHALCRANERKTLKVVRQHVSTYVRACLTTSKLIY